MPKVSSVFIQTLKNNNVDRFFCVPGESYLPVMNELVSNPIFDVVTCRHEGGAGFMAQPSQIGVPFVGVPYAIKQHELELNRIMMENLPINPRRGMLT